MLPRQLQRLVRRRLCRRPKILTLGHLRSLIILALLADLTEMNMDSFDRLLLILRPATFVILPAWGFHEWMGNATLGAILGFAFMWNFMATNENAELAVAFEELREELDEIKQQTSDNRRRD